MNPQVLMMLHAFFGLACLIGALWVLVETLHAGPDNAARIRRLSLAVALAMWTAYLIGGYWYMTSYPPEKALILKGPWPEAHGFFMETKEHLVVMLLLLATYLPIAARADLLASRASRTVVLWTSALIALFAVTADGFGAVIAMGVKVALLAK